MEDERHKCNSLKSKTTWLTLMLLMVLLLVVITSTITIVRGKMLITRLYKVPTDSYCKLRIVGLTDLHGDTIGKKQEIIQKVKDADPDIIVFLGDMVERNRAEESLEALIILTEQLVKFAPVYYVEGNHELDIRVNNPEFYLLMNEKLENLGAVQLENEIVSFIVGEENTVVNLCGITTHYRWGEDERSLITDLRLMDGVNVLICHYPESVIWYDAFEGGGLDLALCGHTHGGLVRVPFLGGYYAPEQSRWPKYDLGEYRVYTDTTWLNYGGEEGSDYLGTMIISGGLAGEHGIPRVNNPMEVSVIEIE